MLGAINKRWLVTVPPKCGLMKLQYALVDRLGVARVVLPGHGFLPVEGYRCRILWVRDPLDRTVSQYRYAMQLGIKIAGPHVVSFNSFVEFLANRRSKAYLFTPQATYVENFKPNIISRMGQDWPFENKWRATYEACANHTTKVKAPVDLDHLSPTALEYLEREYAALDGLYPRKL